jgi:hypothetical protein
MIPNHYRQGSAGVSALSGAGAPHDLCVRWLPSVRERFVGAWRGRGPEAGLINDGVAREGVCGWV